MALFPGDVGGYTTPDGRVVQLPSGLAAQFPALQPVGPPPTLPPPPGQQIGPPPGAAPADPGLAAAPPAPMTPLPLPAGPAPIWSPENSAELAKQTVQSTGTDVIPPPKPPGGGAPAGKPPAKHGTAAAPGSDQATAAPAQGAGAQRPMTDADLAKMGVAGGVNAYDTASDEKKAALNQRADAEVSQADQVGAAMAANSAADLKRLNDMQAESDRRQAAIDQHTDDLAAAAKKIADTKIDRTADHPILTAIGVALATLGTAMQNRDATLAAAYRGQPAPAPVQNPGLAAMYAGIDRKVAAQMADLDNQKAAYGLQSQALTAERGGMKDRLDQMAAMRAGYLDQAKGQIATMMQQTSSPLVKANAAMAISDVDREKAVTLGEAQNRFKTQQAAEAARKQELAIANMHDATTRRGQDVSLEATRETIAAQREEKSADLAARLIEKGDLKGAQRAKDIGERAIWDPRTGDVQLNPAGQAKMQRADQYEAQARQTQDPQQATKLRQAASDLRDSASLNDGVLAPDKATAEKVRPQIEAAQGMVDQIAEASKVLEAGPSAFNREAWAGLKTKLGDLAKNYASAAGERVTVKGIENAMENIISFDPDSMWNREANKGKALAALTALNGIVKEQADRTLKGSGIKSNWTPTAKGEGENDTRLDFSDKTAAEAGADRQLGYLDVGRYTGAQDQAQEQAFNAAASKPGSEAGLSPNAVTHIKALAGKASTASDATFGQIVKTLSNSVSDGLTNDSRVSASLGTLDVLGSANPALRDAVIAALPDMARERIQRLEAARRPVTNVPRVPSKYDPDAAAAADDAARRTAAFAPFQPGAPLAGSPGAGTPR